MKFKYFHIENTLLSELHPLSRFPSHTIQRGKRGPNCSNQRYSKLRVQGRAIPGLFSIWWSCNSLSSKLSRRRFTSKRPVSSQFYLHVSHVLMSGCCRSLGYWNGYSYDRKGAHWGAHSMMTFVLEPAEGEHDFKADVWSLQGRQTIVGSWSKGEDDVLRIKFKMSFSSASVLWASIFFSGRFDPERNALTGIWGLSAELKSPKGKMDIRRILPNYLTLYPSIREFQDNKPRALWRFAIAAVRNDIRRGRWAWSYFSQRRDERKTIVPLLVRSRWFGPPLDAEEIRTLHAITRRLTPADACFYDSKVDHIRAYTWVHE